MSYVNMILLSQANKVKRQLFREYFYVSLFCKKTLLGYVVCCRRHDFSRQDESKQSCFERPKHFNKYHKQQQDIIHMSTYYDYTEVKNIWLAMS